MRVLWPSQTSSETPEIGWRRCSGMRPPAPACALHRVVIGSPHLDYVRQHRRRKRISSGFRSKPEDRDPAVPLATTSSLSQEKGTFADLAFVASVIRTFERGDPAGTVLDRSAVLHAVDDGELTGFQDLGFARVFLERVLDRSPTRNSQPSRWDRRLSPKLQISTYSGIPGHRARRSRKTSRESTGSFVNPDGQFIFDLDRRSAGGKRHAGLSTVEETRPGLGRGEAEVSWRVRCREWQPARSARRRS